MIVAVSLSAAALPAPAAAPSTRAQKLSTAACDAFADYFTIEFLVAFASAFAGLGEELDSGSGGGDEQITKEDIQDIFHLVFSPRLESVTATLGKEAPKSIRGLFAKQRAVFADGIDKLEEIGVTKKQLVALARLDLSADADVKQILGDVDIPKRKLTAAAREFGKRADALDLNDEVSKAQQRDFQQTGTTCGVFPASARDCEQLVASDLSSPLVGGEPTVGNNDGSCTYAGPTGADGDEPVMAVDVYQTPRTFERLVEQLQGAEELDPDTRLADGFSSFSSTKTCGKTLYTRTDDQSIVIAVCPPGDGEIDTADLLRVRDSILSRSVLDRKSG